MKEDFLRSKVPSRLLQRKGDQFVLSFSKDRRCNGLKIEVNKIHTKHRGETPSLSNSKDNETLEQITKVLLKHPTVETVKEGKNPTLSVAGPREIV